MSKPRTDAEWCRLWDRAWESESEAIAAFNELKATDPTEHSRVMKMVWEEYERRD